MKAYGRPRWNSPRRKTKRNKRGCPCCTYPSTNEYYRGKARGEQKKEISGQLKG